MFGKGFGIRDSAIQYMENLVLFDMCQCPKYMIYYEDLINHGEDAFVNLYFKFLKLPYKHLNWEKESAISLKNYEATPMSGGNLDFHKQNIDDLPLMGKIMKQANSYIFEKYLSRYEQK